MTMQKDGLLSLARLRAMNNEHPLVEWLSLAEASIYVGVSPLTFSREVRPHVTTRRLGRRVLVNLTSLDAFMMFRAQKKSRPS